MADGKVRLVRCPKCSSVLPELSGYSLYQCAACGAVLKAEFHNPEVDAPSDKPDGERVEVVLDESKRRVDQCVASDANTESNDPETNTDRDERGIAMEKNAGGFQRLGEIRGHQIGVKEGMEGFQRFTRTDLLPPVEMADGYQRLGTVNHRQIGDSVGMEEFQRTKIENPRHSNHWDEGSSMPRLYHLEYVASRVERLKQDRAKLLRMLDELEDQLRKSCDVADEARKTSRHFNGYPKPHPSMNRPSDMAAHDIYPSTSSSNHIPVNMYTCLDPYLSHGHNTILHQSSCPYLHCYRKHLELPGPVLENQPDAFVSRVCNPRSVNYQPSSCQPDVKCSIGIRHALGGRHCYPLAGGAPFITCRDCFELLQLPKRVLLMEKNKHKVRCGACSAIVMLGTVRKKLVIISQADAKPAPLNSNDGFQEAVEASFPPSHFNKGNMKFYPDGSGYEFHSMDEEPPFASKRGRDFDFSNSPDMQSMYSLSVHTSGDEEQSNFIGHSVKSISFPPFPASSLHEHVDHSSNNHVVSRFGKGNMSMRSNPEKFIQKKTTSSKDLPLTTKMEISFNEFPDSGTNHVLAEVNREDRLGINKGSDSFFAGIIKKSFKDLSRSNERVVRGQNSVRVNGHPIPESMVRKAEKLAGSILPGQYWYDFQCGFWGAMGGPCLGIIPPFIEEFNSPMPKNCAGGNTGVLVNGRELHEKDLGLLARRGLPTNSGRSYKIEISGMVVDEGSCEVLCSLGKLAPSVEKFRRGFGMKVPGAVR